MPEPQHAMNNIKEFLMRKGPGGVPFWGYGLMGAAVIGGVIYINAKGGFAALAPAGAGGTAPSATGTGSGGSGSGGDIQPTPPGPSQPPGAGGTPPPTPPPAGTPPQLPASPDPPLVQGSQQSSSGGSGISGPAPSTPEPNIPVNFSAGALLFQKLGLPTMDFRPGGNYGPPIIHPAASKAAQKEIIATSANYSAAAHQRPGITGQAALAQSTGLEGHPGKQADDVLSNPIPTTQTQVVQHTKPHPGGKGNQFL